MAETTNPLKRLVEIGNRMAREASVALRNLHECRENEARTVGRRIRDSALLALSELDLTYSCAVDLLRVRHKPVSPLPPQSPRSPPPLPPQPPPPPSQPESPRPRERTCCVPLDRFPATRAQMYEFLVKQGIKLLKDIHGRVLLDVDAYAKKRRLSPAGDSDSDSRRKRKKKVNFAAPEPSNVDGIYIEEHRIKLAPPSDDEENAPDLTPQTVFIKKEYCDEVADEEKQKTMHNTKSKIERRRESSSESSSGEEKSCDKFVKQRNKKKHKISSDCDNDEKSCANISPNLAQSEIKTEHSSDESHKIKRKKEKKLSCDRIPHIKSKRKIVSSDSDDESAEKSNLQKQKELCAIDTDCANDDKRANEAIDSADVGSDSGNRSRSNSNDCDKNEKNVEHNVNSKSDSGQSDKANNPEDSNLISTDEPKVTSINDEYSDKACDSEDGHSKSVDKSYSTLDKLDKTKDASSTPTKKIRKKSLKNDNKYSEDSESAIEKSPVKKNGYVSSSDSAKSSNEEEKLFNDVKHVIASNYSKSLEKEKMTEAISHLLNGDTSNSDEEFVTKINGKMKNSEKNNRNDKEMENSDSQDVEKPNDLKKSKKKLSLSPQLLDSDSDGVQINDSASENNSKKNNSDVKEVLDSSDSNESEVFKPSIRRKKKKNSDKSNDDSDSDQKTVKKRRRIKNISGDDSDNSGNKSGDESGSDADGDTTKKGRKNIRKVKRSVNLDEATKIAARNERERIQRIAERQKLYNESLFDESGRPDEVIKLDKVVLDFDPDSKEPLISVDKGLVSKLKPHQANGVKFMWNACFESVSQIKKSKGSGCILAHCMGLGKTLQIVTLTHTLLTHQRLTKVERVLVVCPLSTVHNWVNEFNMWLKFAKCKDDIEIYEISKYKQNYERSSKLKDWLENGGVCVLGYDMFRNLSADNNKKFRKAQLISFQKALVDPGPDLVVCDEGHLLKNEKTSLSQSMNKVKTLRRIVLTGTPLQNNLKEYYCMVQFVKPNLLGKYNEYLNRFVNPITNGQYTDSTEQDIRVMKRRSHVLHKMLDGAVQRRDYSVLAPFLPPKHEYVLFISLTEIQIKLYSYYMENFSRRPQPDRKNTGFLFPDFQALQRIWTHPLVLKANSERYEIMQQKKRDKEEEDSEGSLADFIDDDSTTPDETSEDDESTEDSDDSSSNKKNKSKNKKAVTKRVTRATVVTDDDEEVTIIKEEEPRQDNPTEWWISLCSEDELDDVRHSNKLILLLDILKECEAIGDKLLVFSQSLYSLDLIEQFLWKIDEATQKGEDDQKLAGHLGSWSPGIDYFRLDGSTSCENRSIWCKNFNKDDNPRARLFLISTRAGGLGINLVAANRVVIFDMSWNPSHDVQSIFRVYRFGQKKPCFIYRFLALGTMEEKIYERQVTKQAISKRVIDEQQIDRHYAESDLAELYTFCPVPEGPREVPNFPKDRLFADLLKQHDTMIYKYHEHDSLLENKEEETLTEEERKAAWEDYENEKTRPPNIFGGQVLAGFQQQQQHHLAMSALLQQENPNLSEQQVASMIPGLLQHMYQNGDPVLMQRMNAMLGAQNSMMGFKYPQNTMMNTNLSSMLNTGTPGTTGYPTSWQQQQQIQLQRLQQQQAMHANLKYYAGGLGSRDTVDMAALQQRQRALMMASNSNMPQRGRPPKSSSMIAYPTPPLNSVKKVPPVSTGDVVDLDSE